MVARYPEYNKILFMLCLLSVISIIVIVLINSQQISIFWIYKLKSTLIVQGLFGGTELGKKKTEFYRLKMQNFNKFFFFIGYHWFSSVHIGSHWFTSFHVSLRWFTSVHIGSRRFTSVHMGSHW